MVIDRGMAFEENLEQLRARGLHYLVASRQGERNRWLAEFEDLEGFDAVKSFTDLAQFQQGVEKGFLDAVGLLLGVVPWLIALVWAHMEPVASAGEKHKDPQ